MIVIDMEMPKSCDECPLFDDRWDYPTCYVNQLSSGYNFPIKDKRMDFCPIKCNINDIKAEINEYKHRQLSMGVGIKDLELGKQMAIEYIEAIIDRHIEEGSEE